MGGCEKTGNKGLCGGREKNSGYVNEEGVGISPSSLWPEGVKRYGLPCLLCVGMLCRVFAKDIEKHRKDQKKEAAILFFVFWGERVVSFMGNRRCFVVLPGPTAFPPPNKHTQRRRRNEKCWNFPHRRPTFPLIFLTRPSLYCTYVELQVVSFLSIPIMELFSGKCHWPLVPKKSAIDCCMTRLRRLSRQRDHEKCKRD